MPEFQTAIQDLTAILRGSGKIEVSPYQATPAWTDVGSVSGIEFDEGIEMAAEENDNADSAEEISKHEPTLKFNMHEALRAVVLDIIRGNVDTKTVNAGTLQTGKTQDFAANTTEADVLYELTYQNADGSAPTITSAKKDPAGTNVSLVDGTDYELLQNSANTDKWCIRFISGGAYDATKLIRITSSHTPAASVDYEAGINTTVPSFMLRLTTKNGSYPFYLIGYKCSMKTGKKFSYKKDSDQDRRMILPVEIKFKHDDLYHSGAIYKTNQTGGI